MSLIVLFMAIFGSNKMKTLIIFIMTCGQTDVVLIREVGKPAYTVEWAEIIYSEDNSEHFLGLLEDAEKIKIDHTIGMCI